MKKDKLNSEKVFLINILYHMGFNDKGIKALSNVSKSDIKNAILK